VTIIKRRKTSAKNIAFTVTFKKPAGASVEDCRSYVEDAVATWRGQCRPPGGHGDDDPGDPMWGLDWETVKAKRAFMRKQK
jgi:hypothetical protein